MTDKNVNPDDNQADENRDDNVDERFADIVGDVDIDADQSATDSIAMARQHGEVEGGFKLVVDELEKVASNHGLTSFGEVGDAFDPNLHEALMQMPMEGVCVTSVSQVMQPGYKLGDRVVRPARVAVSDPDPNATSPDESGQADDESAAADETDETPRNE